MLKFPHCVVEVVRHYREEGDVSEVSNNQSFSASTEFFGKLNNFLITYYWVSRYLEVLEFLTNRTVGKFENFYITQILREINFGEARSSKTVVFGHFRGSRFC